MSAIPISRITDVQTTAPEPAASAVALSAPEHGLTALASAAGTVVGSAARASGGSGGPGTGALFGFIVAAAIGAGLWMHTRINLAEEASRAAVDKLGSYDARMMRIELALEKHADAAQELPEIRRQLDRLIEDQRSTAGSIATLERLIRGEPEERTP